MITDLENNNKKIVLNCRVNTTMPPECVLKGIWKQKEAQLSHNISPDGWSSPITPANP